MNAVAAYHKHRSACVVVDFGTSINYDVVSPDGEYLGGVLAPGVEVSLDAVLSPSHLLLAVSGSNVRVYSVNATTGVSTPTTSPPRVSGRSSRPRSRRG